MNEPARDDRSPGAVFLIFLRLGLVAFGGPVAHLAWFREEFVVRRRWLSDGRYAELVALCQFLPGPASSQVGMALGLSRAGPVGALAAWAGFTLPSALALVLLALGIARHGELIPPGLLHGLKVAAVAVVAQALWGMARQHSRGSSRLALTLLAASTALLLPGLLGQLLPMLLAGAFGALWLQARTTDAGDALPLTIGARTGAACLALFFLLLVGLPLLASVSAAPALHQLDAFYRAGALVFGGGHVVLPLLQAEVVDSGMVAPQAFLAGYGLVQAIPGPLFTFAAFLGASMEQAPSGWSGAALCLAAIFLPSFLLVAGALPFWERLRRSARLLAALSGVNAAVVGLLLAAFYNPVFSNAIRAPVDLGLALLALLALMRWKASPALVVLACGLAGWALG